MLKKVFVCLITLFVCLAGTTAAAERGAFAAVGIGARPLGMGGAFVAVADTPDALYWNPAGVGQLSKTQVSSMQTDLFGLGIQYNWLAAVQPVGKYTFGIGYNGLDASKAFGDFPYQEGSVLGSVAGEAVIYGQHLRWGANLKYNFLKGGSDLVNTEQTGLGIDIGLLYQKDALKLGFVVRDLYTRLAGELVEESMSEDVVNVIPPDVALGASFITGPVLWTLDISGLATEPKVHAGVEYAVNNQVSLRAGYKAGMFTVGLGMKTGSWVLDYAYNTHQVGDAQRFSVGIIF